MKMLESNHLNTSVASIRMLIQVREAFYKSAHRYSLDVVPDDPEAIEIINGLIHRVAVQLADLAAGVEDA